jgi:hypothetical protein
MDARSQLAAGVVRHFDNLLAVIHSNSVLLSELNPELPLDCGNLVKESLLASRHAAHLLRQLAGYSQNQVFEFQALVPDPIVERELPGLDWQSLRPRGSALRTDSNASASTEANDDLVWVNPAFNPADMVGFPANLDRVAPLNMDRLILDEVRTLRRLFGANIQTNRATKPGSRRP